MYLTASDAVLAVAATVENPESVAVRLHLTGAAGRPAAHAEQPQAGVVNYFVGNDSAQWQTNVPTYGRVRLGSVYPGVDVTYYGNDGQLEYDFIVAPHADPAQIRLKFDGAAPQLAANGTLLLQVAGSPSSHLRFDRPVAYQIGADGRRTVVASSYALSPAGEVAFELGAYDPTRTLVIDPTLLFAGTLGTGNQQTAVTGMAVDAAGEMVLTGTTNDLSFPTTTGVIFPICGPVNHTNGAPRCGASSLSSAFITKISADGTSLVFSTYLHGTTGYETGGPVTVDSNGVIYAAGMTLSNDFPITPDAFQKLCSPKGDSTTGGYPYDEITASCSRYQSAQYVFGSRDIYLVKLNASGTQLLYGTFLGGDNDETVTGIGLDAAGNIYLSGNSASAVTTYAPGTGSSSISYPVTNSAYEATGQVNVYLATLTKFSNDGHTLLYSSFLGTKSPGYPNALSQSLAVGQNGVAFVGGYTSAPDFPTTSGSIKPSCLLDPSNAARCRGVLGFVSALDTTKSGAASLLYSTFVGGNPTQSTSNADTQVTGMVADASNGVIITGATLTPDFPTTSGAYQPTCVQGTQGNPNCATAFLSKINPTGSAFVWSTFYGATGTAAVRGTQGTAIALDSKGRINLFGYSQDQSVGLPQLNPIQAYQGGDKVFLATFTGDGSQLVFASRFGAANTNEEPTAYGGLALDTAGNVYFSGTTTNAAFPVTIGTYATPVTASFARTFFAKMSPVLYPSSTALTVSPLTTVTGVSVNCTAVVTSTFSTAIPTGTVKFMNGPVLLGTGVLDATGKAVFSNSALGVGSYSVTAVYQADTDYEVSTSAAQTLTINVPVVPTTGLTLSVSSAPFQSPILLTATVTGSAGVPTGTVMFYDGITLLGSSTINGAGVATYTIATLSVGTHSLSARYLGDNVYAQATIQAQGVTVTKDPSSAALSASPAAANLGASVTFTATITSTSPGTPSGLVTFFDGTANVGSGTLNSSGVAMYNTSTLAAGTHTITAMYAGDNAFASSTSPGVMVTVVAPAFSLSASPTALTVLRPSSATTTLTVTPVGGYNGGIALTCGTLPAYMTCSFSNANLTFSGANTAQTSLLTIAPAGGHAMLGPLGIFPRAEMPAYAVLVGLIGMAWKARRQRRRLSLAVALFLATAIAGLTGCGGKPAAPSTTPAGTYTVTVSATPLSGTASTISLQVTVQ